MRVIARFGANHLTTELARWRNDKLICWIRSARVERLGFIGWAGSFAPVLCSASFVSGLKIALSVRQDVHAWTLLLWNHPEQNNLVIQDDFSNQLKCSILSSMTPWSSFCSTTLRNACSISYHNHFSFFSQHILLHLSHRKFRKLDAGTCKLITSY